MRRSNRSKRCPRIRLIVWPGAEQWVPSQARLDALACRLSKDVVVEFVPRSALRKIWQRDHGGRPLPPNPYAFRAYSRGNKSVVFVDHTETPASAAWLLLHELAHVDLAASNLLHTAMRQIPKPPGYLTSDAAHESHPEEQLANRVATRMMPVLGHRRQALNRLWWRRRVRRRTR